MRCSICEVEERKSRMDTCSGLVVAEGGCRQSLVAVALLRHKNSEFSGQSCFQKTTLRMSRSMSGESKCIYIVREYKLRVAKFACF